MKLVLNNGFANFTELGYTPLKRTKVEIISNEFKKGQAVVIKINDLPTQTVYDYFEIPESVLEEGTIQIACTVKNNNEGTTKTYKMDPITLNKAVCLGNDTAEQFPISLKVIQTNMDQMWSKLMDAILTLQNQVKILENRVDILETEGDIV